MYRVRYYDRMIHPDHFRGLRGWYVRALNWVRWKLETYVQKQVLKYLAATGELPAERRGELLRAFRLDVKAEKLQKEQTSPLHEPVEQEIAETPRTRAERYAEGAVRTKLDALDPEEDGRPQRPQRLDDLIGRYAFSNRAKKYARGRAYLADPEGNFEPVEDESGSNDSHHRDHGAGGIGDRNSDRASMGLVPTDAEGGEHRRRSA